ncbi:MAG TPA: sigma-70 family RNA polymerase sigma factor [Polyangiales bacterium]|nr:sigma-70 family RNA polymerase sigma factor [Polyangiales bacterium]
MRQPLMTAVGASHEQSGVARTVHAAHASACSGDTFRAFYAEHFAFVWRCLGALGVPAASQDDAAQEVFVVVHRRLPEFRGESSVRTWLYGIVRNIASNVRRSQRRKGGLEELQDSEPSEQPDPLRSLETREAADFVQQFVSALDDNKRDLFVLAIIEQLSMPEVAPILGVPLNTAYTRLRTLRIEFQSALAQYRAVP